MKVAATKHIKSYSFQLMTIGTQCGMRFPQIVGDYNIDDLIGLAEITETGITGKVKVAKIKRVDLIENDDKYVFLHVEVIS